MKIQIEGKKERSPIILHLDERILQWLKVRKTQNNSKLHDIIAYKGVLVSLYTILLVNLFVNGIFPSTFIS